MSFDADADYPLTFPLDPARIAELDLGKLRASLHHLIDTLPEDVLRALAHMLSLPGRPPDAGYG